MPTIRVFEHESLTTYDDNRSLTTKQLDALYQFNDSHGGKYFKPIRNGVKFTSYVGVLQIGRHTIEILPKADKHNTSKEDYGIWQGVLLRMLAECRKIKLESISKAFLNKRYNSILELYFELFLDETEKLLHQGLIKRYRKNSGNIKALKGRLEFSRQIQSNLVHKERFYTNHQVYDQDHLINQILLRTLTVLKSITNNPFQIDRVNRLLLNFPDIAEVRITKEHFSRVIFDRKSKPYSEAISISKMILLNYSPDISNGNDNMLALLFDMNALWEEYVYRKLCQVQKASFSVQDQTSTMFWESRTVRPDIVIKHHDKTIVLDTKWKILYSADPDDDDLKQMYVYNHYFDCSHSYLIYPQTVNVNSTSGSYHPTKSVSENLQCTVGFIDVLKDGTLNQEIATNILALVEVE